MTGRERSSSVRPSRNRPSERQTSGHEAETSARRRRERLLKVLAGDETRDFDVASEVAFLHGLHVNVAKPCSSKRSRRIGAAYSPVTTSTSLARCGVARSSVRGAVAQRGRPVDRLEEASAEFRHRAALGETLDERGHQSDAVLCLIETFETLGPGG